MKLTLKLSKYILLFLLIFFSYSCGKNRLSYTEAKELLQKNIYPNRINADYSLIVRYETKDNIDKWQNFPWKRNNDILEKAGLIKQVVLDTFIMFYVQSQARFEKRHTYLYKVILSNKIKSMMSNSTIHSVLFDEWDYYNRHTGRKDWYRSEVVCGEFMLDTILNINQKKGPLDVYVEFKEKFYATPFNEFIDYGEKKLEGETFIRTVVVRKYPEEDWKVVD